MPVTTIYTLHWSESIDLSQAVETINGYSDVELFAIELATHGRVEDEIGTRNILRNTTPLEIRNKMLVQVQALRDLQLKSTVHPDRSLSYTPWYGTYKDFNHLLVTPIIPKIIGFWITNNLSSVPHPILSYTYFDTIQTAKIISELPQHLAEDTIHNHQRAVIYFIVMIILFAACAHYYLF